MEVISTRRYEARPPADSHASILVDPTNAVATVKEEEWETRKKKEITTTRQIETRVKRQVVLEDGEVVVDSGPQVTTNTTEDVEQQEHTTQEESGVQWDNESAGYNGLDLQPTKQRRTTGDEPQKVEWPSGVSPGAVVQKELNETIVKSREEIEELLETEDRQQLGDISDEAYLQAVRNNRGDLRVALAESTRQLAGQQPSGPRVLQHTTRSNKVVDTEKTLERSELKQGGQIVTERKTTVEHEEIKDDELPEGVEGTESRKEASQRYVKTRDEDIVDYVQNGERVAREMRFVSETTEAERTGDWPHDNGHTRPNRLHKSHGFGTTGASPGAGGAASSRKDALTRKPLDLEEEDEARRFETSKWLESHFGSESRSSRGNSLDGDEAPVHNTSTSYINVTMRSARSPGDKRRSQQQQQPRLNGRESSSPSGYFQGISEWSERYQSTEKQSSHVRARSPQYIVETTRESSSRSNGYHAPIENPRNHKESSYTRTYEASRRHQERHSPPHERPKADPPSPPLRRKAREQVTTSRTERNYGQQESVARPPSVERTSSPVHVVQRTWESRSREAVQEEHRRGGRTAPQSDHRRHVSPERTRPRPRSPESPRSISPVRREKTEHPRPSKSPSPSKYKIGESFRKLVGKLRSASSERRGKRVGGGSTSQLTQTDEGSTYLQYNSVDRNVPLGPEYDGEDRPPERPPRSPRGQPQVAPAKPRYRDSAPRHSEQYTKEFREASSGQRTEQPIHRYYLGEDPYGGTSIYGREKGYREAKPHSRHRGRTVDEEYSGESGSLGRFSKSTGRLANGYDVTDGHERTSMAQTLPRKMHNGSQQHLSRHQQSSSSTTTTTTTTSTSSSTTRRLTNGHHRQSPPPPKFGNGASGQQYGSMINISFRNTVTSPPKTTHFVQTSINTQPPLPPPAPQKPERTYKSTLSRSKSFNVEIADDGVVTTPRSNGYGQSNGRASTQMINRLDETPPLKSPGILASISRSNRDLIRNGRSEY